MTNLPDGKHDQNQRVMVANVDNEERQPTLWSNKILIKVLLKGPGIRDFEFSP